MYKQLTVKQLEENYPQLAQKADKLVEFMAVNLVKELKKALHTQDHQLRWLALEALALEAPEQKLDWPNCENQDEWLALAQSPPMKAFLKSRGLSLKQMSLNNLQQLLLTFSDENLIIRFQALSFLIYKFERKIQDQKARLKVIQLKLKHQMQVAQLKLQRQMQVAQLKLQHQMLVAQLKLQYQMQVAQIKLQRQLRQWRLDCKVQNFQLLVNKYGLDFQKIASDQSKKDQKTRPSLAQSVKLVCSVAAITPALKQFVHQFRNYQSKTGEQQLIGVGGLIKRQQVLGISQNQRLVGWQPFVQLANDLVTHLHKNGMVQTVLQKYFQLRNQYENEPLPKKEYFQRFQISPCNDVAQIVEPIWYFGGFFGSTTLGMKILLNYFRYFKGFYELDFVSHHNKDLQLSFLLVVFVHQYFRWLVWKVGICKIGERSFNLNKIPPAQLSKLSLTSKQGQSSFCSGASRAKASRASHLS